MDTSAPVVSSGTLDPESERVVSELISRYRDEAPVSSGATSSGAVAPDAETSSGIIAAPADSEPTMQTMRDAYPYARYIGLGDVGRDVEWIQRLLVRTGYRSGPVTSVFDQVTSDEFSRYMRDRTGDSRGTYGQLGPQTMARFLSLPLE